VVFTCEPSAQLFRDRLSRHYINLARVQRKCGRPAEAAAATRERQRLWSDDPVKLYEVALELALCMPLVGQGKAELTAAEQAERRGYGDEAVAALRQAIARGYTDLDQLTKALSLAPLRSRADFQKLLAELRAKAD